MGRASIVVLDARGISEYEIDGEATVFFLARGYTDDRSSAAASGRARERIGSRGPIRRPQG